MINFIHSARRKAEQPSADTVRRPDCHGCGEAIRFAAKIAALAPVATHKLRGQGHAYGRSAGRRKNTFYIFGL
jgi:hypothetical protein